MRLKKMALRALKPLAEGVFARDSVAGLALRAVNFARFRAWCARYDQPPTGAGDAGRFQLFSALVQAGWTQDVISYLEFGVYRGDTLKWWLEKNTNPGSRFVGFDTFTGLPEDWNPMFRRGDFSTDGKPPWVDAPRCRFEKGLFQRTLPGFIRSFPFHGQTIVHLDADLYSSTLFVLLTVGPHLKEGDLLIFDEFWDYMSEFRAFLDFLAAYPIDYKVLGRTEEFAQVAVRIEGTPT